MGAADLNAWRRQNSDAHSLVITLLDGRRMRGNMMVPRDKSLADVFNMPTPFFDFEDFDQGPMVIAKSSITSLRPHTLPAADQLDKKLTQLDKSDPYRILGLAKAATKDEIRAAYLGLARLYHPDRFAAIDMPPEMAEYVDAMARRINIAYGNIMPSTKADTPDDATP